MDWGSRSPGPTWLAVVHMGEGLPKSLMVDVYFVSTVSRFLSSTHFPTGVGGGLYPGLMDFWVPSGGPSTDSNLDPLSLVFKSRPKARTLSQGAQVRRWGRGVVKPQKAVKKCE